MMGDDTKIQPSRRLHDAARRYCIERHAYWCDQYAKLCAKSGQPKYEGTGYSEEHLKTFPRYNVLCAILNELERINPHHLSGLSETQELFVVAGQTAHNSFTKPPHLPFTEGAMHEERKAFCDFIRNFPKSQLAKVEPLFYRRILTTIESDGICKELSHRWNIKSGYWFPLAGESPPHCEAFDSEAFHDAFPLERLRERLTQVGTHRIFELQEFGTVYEQDVSAFAPSYASGGETYSFPPDFNWVIYASHEGSITVAGRWLLPEVKSLWPEWNEFHWKPYWQETAK